MIRRLKYTFLGAAIVLTGTVVAQQATRFLNVRVLEDLEVDQTATLNALSVQTGPVTLPAASIPDSALSSNVPLLNVANTFTKSGTELGSAAIAIAANTPNFLMHETDQGADEGLWAFSLAGGSFRLGAVADAYSGSIPGSSMVFNVTRSGADVSSIGIGSGAGTSTITLNGVNVTDYARLSQSNTFTAQNAFVGSHGTDTRILRSNTSGSLVLAGGNSNSSSAGGRILLRGIDTNNGEVLILAGSSGNVQIGGSTIGIPSQPAIWVPGAPDHRLFVMPTIEDAEAMQGFERGWTDVEIAGRKHGHRWKLVGNAVTTRVAEWVAGRISEPGDPVVELDGPGVGARWPTAAWGEAGKAHRVSISEFPLLAPYEHLSAVVDLNEATPLSARAINGFRNRDRKSVV